jgi:CheY-like chemotaxis protein
MVKLSDYDNLYIVVAGDDINDHQAIKNAFKEHNLSYIVTSVFNGQQLMNLLLKEEFYRTDSYRKPDLIILDLKMKVMNGLEVLDKIQSYQSLSDIPIFILNSGAENDEKILASGVKQIFKKPLRSEELDRLLARTSELETGNQHLSNQ